MYAIVQCDLLGSEMQSQTISFRIFDSSRLLDYLGCSDIESGTASMMPDLRCQSSVTLLVQNRLAELLTTLLEVARVPVSHSGLAP